jgi:hypothetical protein
MTFCSDADSNFTPQLPQQARRAAAGFADLPRRRNVVDDRLRLAALESFAASSTRRQFSRYSKDWVHDRWRRQAQAALDALNGDA